MTPRPIPQEGPEGVRDAAGSAAGGRTSPELAAHEYRLLVESVVDYGIFMLDVAGHVVTWNRGAEAIQGYTADDIVGRHFAAFYTPADVAAGKPVQELEVARDAGRMEDEGWRVRKDGALLWGHVIITAVRDETGALLGFSKVIRDLTDRRRAEQALREAEGRFHQLIDAVSDYAIFMLDPGGHVATWNPGAQRAKGYAPAEVLGKHFSVFYTPEDLRAGAPTRILEEVRTTGRFEDEGWRVRKDGTRFWGNVIITRLIGDGGALLGFAKVTRDLTARRQAEDSLRRSEERLRLLIDGVTDYALYMLDPEGRVSTWNVGAERMKGYTPQEIIGRSFAAFFPEEDVAAGRPERELALALATSRFEDEGYRLRKDGSRLWAHVVVSPIHDERGVHLGFAKVTRDLTVRRAAEETAQSLLREQAARAAAEDANQMKDEFLATVSHELRTPLNAMLGWASLLRNQGDATVAKGIEVIHRNATAQARIIDDILDVSRIITGKLRVETAPTSLVTTVQEAVEVVRPSAAAKSIAIEVRHPTTPAILLADPERLRQVVWNLLSNAVKFTDRGGKVAVDVEDHAAEVTLVVRDSGAGIARGFLPHVFERFRQGDSSSTRRVGGLGLGLSIVRHIVELHGGQVRADSEGEGKGAAFHVMFPKGALSLADQHARIEEMAGSTRPAAFLAGLRVLVVDDDVDARELLLDLLEHEGAVVETAASAAGALAVFPRFRPEVVISDISMPDEDGHSLVRRLRARPGPEGATPAIALTAYARVEDRLAALEAGFNEHLGKPVGAETLVQLVRRLAARAPD